QQTLVERLDRPPLVLRAGQDAGGDLGGAGAGVQLADPVGLPPGVKAAAEQAVVERRDEGVAGSRPEVSLFQRLQEQRGAGGAAGRGEGGSRGARERKCSWVATRIGTRDQYTRGAPLRSPGTRASEERSRWVMTPPFRTTPSSYGSNSKSSGDALQGERGKP